MIRRNTVASLLLVGLLTQSAHAGGRVYQFDANGSIIQIGGFDWVAFNSPSDLTNSSSDLSIALDSNTRFVDIIPNGSSDNIPRLTFTGGPSASSVKIYLGADQDASHPDFVSTNVVPSKGGLHLRGLDASALYESQVYGGITGDFGVQCSGNPCNGTAYYLKVGRLVRFDMGGTMWGDITVTGSSG